MSAYEGIFFLEIIVEGNLVPFARQLEDHKEYVIRERNDTRATHHDHPDVHQQWDYLRLGTLVQTLG